MLRLKPDLSRMRNHDDCCPIHLASTWGHVDIVREMMAVVTTNKSLARLCDGKGYTALDCTAANNQVEVLATLLKEGPGHLVRDVMKKAETALHVALNNHMIGAATYLVEHCKKILNVADGNGNTALHCVVKMKQIQGLQQTLMTMATIISAAAFQAGLNPPKAAQDYNITPFLQVVMLSLIISASMIVVLVSGLPQKHRFPAWVLKIALWGALTCLVYAFVLGVDMNKVDNGWAKNAFLAWMGLMCVMFVYYFVPLVVVLLLWLQ
ncbi:hypothetical protein QJS10_CPB18g01108 [Acorus calamus]|uniref:PGG domain-containing protein n=1 Tax=Acorus calamus TaxID=4465 RepID=A0AAV9CKX1_ACOCL|nr:hypothetical protein QJS10_CPB18g01108 [Acorus calamus]